MPSDFEKNKEQELDRYGVWIKSGPQDVNDTTGDTAVNLEPPVELQDLQEKQPCYKHKADNDNPDYQYLALAVHLPSSERPSQKGRFQNHHYSGVCKHIQDKTPESVEKREVKHVVECDIEDEEQRV